MRSIGIRELRQRASEYLRLVASGETVEVTDRGRPLLGTVNLLTLDDPLLDAAAELDSTVLRTLDAIHLAAAWGLGDRLEALVTYDGRMAEAAEILGLPIASPR